MKKKKLHVIKKPRDLTILKAFRNEIDLKTKVFEDKTKYSRKLKFKRSIKELE